MDTANQQPSPLVGRFRGQSKDVGSKWNRNGEHRIGDDMIRSAWKHVAVYTRTVWG